MRFGLKALEYLKETDEKKYKELLESGELKQYEEKINRKARDYYDKVFDELLEKDPVKDPNNFLEKVQHMNQLKSIAEEFTLHDVIYKDN